MPDKGSAGNKFFEGMVNLNYLKKMKKRLNDTTEYFQGKADANTDDSKPITDDRRVFYFCTAKYDRDCLEVFVYFDNPDE